MKKTQKMSGMGAFLALIVTATVLMLTACPPPNDPPKSTTWTWSSTSPVVTLKITGEGSAPANGDSFTLTYSGKDVSGTVGSVPAASIMRETASDGDGGGSGLVLTVTTGGEGSIVFDTTSGSMTGSVTFTGDNTPTTVMATLTLSNGGSEPVLPGDDNPPDNPPGGGGSVTQPTNAAELKDYLINVLKRDAEYITVEDNIVTLNDSFVLSTGYNTRLTIPAGVTLVTLSSSSLYANAHLTVNGTLDLGSNNIYLNNSVTEAAPATIDGSGTIKGSYEMFNVNAGKKLIIQGLTLVGATKRTTDYNGTPFPEGIGGDAEDSTGVILRVTGWADSTTDPENPINGGICELTNVTFIANSYGAIYIQQDGEVKGSADIIGCGSGYEGVVTLYRSTSLNQGIIGYPKLTMTELNITGCEISGSYGTLLNQCGTVSIISGSISNNRFDLEEGSYTEIPSGTRVVWITGKNAYMQMGSGLSITDNDGFGVYVGTDTNLDNISGEDGPAEFVLNGGSITGNMGGVYVSGGGSNTATTTFTMNSGTIGGNQIDDDNANFGFGIFAENAKLTIEINGGTVYGIEGYAGEENANTSGSYYYYSRYGELSDYPAYDSTMGTAILAGSLPFTLDGTKTIPAPVFSPDAAAVAADTWITFADYKGVYSGYEIYFTYNGEDPTSNSNHYIPWNDYDYMKPNISQTMMGSYGVDGTLTIKAISIPSSYMQEAGWAASAVASAEYTIEE
ncbi:MAG: hypothetical protein LBM77_00080 [Spirochaetaceae bacterium]|jgi:hypothetical protein|nr:hypothetical protein [Spirochaetaceae bacterium]